MPRLLCPLLLILTLGSAPVVLLAQDEPPAETEPGARFGQREIGSDRLPSDRGFERVPRGNQRPLPGQTEFRERRPLFDRRDPRTESFGGIDDRRQRPGTGFEPRSQLNADLNRAVEQVQAQHGGKILSADRMRLRGQDVYRVKVLTPEGRVKVVQLPQTPNAPTPATEEPR